MGIINRNKKNGRFATKKSIEGNAKRVAKMRQHVDFSVSPVIAPLLPDNPVSGDESLITVSPESDINIGHPVTPAASNNSIIPDSKTPIVHSKSPSSPVPVSTVCVDVPIVTTVPVAGSTPVLRKKCRDCAGSDSDISISPLTRSSETSTISDSDTSISSVSAASETSTLSDSQT